MAIPTGITNEEWEVWKKFLGTEDPQPDLERDTICYKVALAILEQDDKHQFEDIQAALYFEAMVATGEITVRR